MGYDREKLKARLNSVTSRNGGGGGDGPSNRWFPKKNKKSQIRLMDSLNKDAEDPFVELWFHYNVAGMRSFLCLEKNFGKECPACEEGRKLAMSGKQGDKDLGKRIIPRQRFFTYVVDRDEETPVAKMWGFGVTIYKKLMSALMDDDYCNFLEPKNGLDATVELAKQEDKSFADTVFNFKRKESPLADSEKEIKRILESRPKVEDVFRPLSAVQIRKKFEDWFAQGDIEQEETVKGKALESDEVVDKETERSVAEAFGEALNDL